MIMYYFKLICQDIFDEFSDCAKNSWSRGSEHGVESWDGGRVPLRVRTRGRRTVGCQDAHVLPVMWARERAAGERDLGITGGSCMGLGASPDVLASAVGCCPQ